MRIHSEGYSILIILFIFLILINVSVWAITGGKGYTPSVIIGASVLIFLFTAWFFRKPDRILPEVNDRLVFAPADGKIVAAEETVETEYFSDKRLKLSIFMSPLNAHLNLYPVSGTVKYYRYHPGKYIVAWHPKSSEKNEHSTLVIEIAGKTEILIRQIAGAVARRIVTYADTGMPVVQFQEMGFIKFGSRVDLYLPIDSKLKVEMGEKVYTKRTVLASLK